MIRVNTASSEFAYWVGFLLADGCISERPKRQPRLMVELASCDYTHLIKLKEFFD